MRHQRSLLVVVFAQTCNALSLLGAGEGRGSCPAPPFRVSQVNWPNGCPLNVPCCNEFGYCRTEAEWLGGQFRDCNGLSNQQNLHDDVIKLEAIFAAIKNGGTSLGPIGPIIIGGNGPIGGNGGSGGSGGSAPAVIPVVNSSGAGFKPIVVNRNIVRGQGGEGGDGGNGGEGGFRGAGGNGGSGGSAGANGGRAGNGGNGGKGGAGAAGGNGGDGGSASNAIVSEYDIVVDLGDSNLQILDQPPILSILSGRGGNGGGGGLGGDGIGQQEGSNGGNGGRGGKGQIAGNGGLGGNGGKGGINSAGGNGGDGGAGGAGVDKVLLSLEPVEVNSVFEQGASYSY